jgi:hypothetical protein
MERAHCPTSCGNSDVSAAVPEALTEDIIMNDINRTSEPVSMIWVQRLPAPAAVLEAAHVPFHRHQIGTRRWNRHDHPRYFGSMIASDWSDRVSASPEAQTVITNLKAQRSAQAKAAAAHRQATTVARGRPAKSTSAEPDRVAALRDLVAECAKAQAASDRAKTHAAANVHYLDWSGSEASYRASRAKVAADYAEKERALRAICALAPAAGVVFGWGGDPESHAARWVLYVDLPAGQVSWHTRSRGTGPTYKGRWDGVRDAAAGRIAEQQRELSQGAASATQDAA